MLAKKAFGFQIIRSDFGGSNQLVPNHCRLSEIRTRSDFGIPLYITALHIDFCFCPCRSSLQLLWWRKMATYWRRITSMTVLFRLEWRTSSTSEEEWNLFINFLKIQLERLSVLSSRTFSWPHNRLRLSQFWMQKSSFAVLFCIGIKKYALCKHVKPINYVCLHPVGKKGPAIVYTLSVWYPNCWILYFCEFRFQTP